MSPPLKLWVAGARPRTLPAAVVPVVVGTAAGYLSSGRLVLGVLGETNPERISLSDDVCTGLQIVEHIQDVKEDLGNGRVYLPQADLRVFGCGPAELNAAHAGPELRMVLRLEAGRARRLLASVAPLGRTLPPRFRFAVCGFAAGGMAALDEIERADHDVLGLKPRPRPLRPGRLGAGRAAGAGARCGFGTDRARRRSAAGGLRSAARRLW